MFTCVEELPVEIWLTIFCYLEAHDLFHAFHNLNNYFESILASNHLSFYVRLKETENNHLQYWSDSIFNRIKYLRPLVQSRSNYLNQFLYCHAKKFIRLQSLSIRISPSYTPYVCQALKQLNVLEYLSVISTPYRILFESILSIPTLRVCQLTFRESPRTITYNLNVHSNLHQLYIVFLDNINYSLINELLICTPKLKRLEISGSYFSFDEVSILSNQLFILPELRIYKLKLENGYFIPNCFKYLHTTMPVLKYFYFNYNKHILLETFFDFFVNHWWSIIKQIQCIDIYIKGHVRIDTMNNNQMNLQKYKEILLAQCDQSNKSFQIQWNEQQFTTLKPIEITIVKS